MTSIADGSVIIQTSAASVPSPPSWFGEVVLMGAHLRKHGVLTKISEGVREFPRMRRDLMLAIDPAQFSEIEGSGDTEVLFHLALTFGLEDDPLTAIELMAGFVEEVGERHGVQHPLKMTVATSDGERIIAARYSQRSREARVNEAPWRKRAPRTRTSAASGSGSKYAAP